MDYCTFSKDKALSQRRTESWGSLTWLASRKIGNVEGLTLGRVVIKSGKSNPRHCHRSCEEVLYLMAGRLNHTVGDETVVLDAGDSLTIPAGVFHNAMTISDEDADMIVAYSSADRDFELETSSRPNLNK